MWLRVRSGPDEGAAVELPEDRVFVLGRQRGCDLIVRDSRASRRHAELESLPNDKWRLRDLESANGTLVDGGRVTDVTLEGGEEIKIGSVVIAVTRTAPPGHAPPEAATGEEGRAITSATGHTPVGATDLGPQLATQSMVRRLVDASCKRASRSALAAGGIALAAVLAVVILLVTGVIGGSDENAVPKVVAAVSPSTALVLTEGARPGSGSGWVLNAGAGLIVTNGHVINQGTRFRVVVGGRTRDATVAAVAPCEDLALLKVRDHTGLKAASLAPAGSIKQGETVVALGFPGDAAPGDAPTSTTGVVSVARTAFKDPAEDVPAYPEVLQTDTPLNPGNSGGPLVDLDGRIVGVNSAARSTGSDGRALQNVNYAITIDHARQVLGDLQGDRAQDWTGLTFGYPTTEEQHREGLTTGPRVTGIIPGTPAASSGIKVGDVVHGVNGTTVQTSLSSLCSALGGGLAGDTVELNIADPGKSIT
ncbi:MAG: putative serine protease PepD, partial [Solirubrobacteraceae bacterium]|nr:putative serine protease PepD [Solirubrobacteraceae bacterium]